jgi:hypothetical protein
MDWMEKYPCSPPGGAGSVAGTGGVTAGSVAGTGGVAAGRVDTIAVDDATVSPNNNTTIKTVKERIIRPPIGITKIP